MTPIRFEDTKDSWDNSDGENLGNIFDSTDNIVEDTKSIYCEKNSFAIINSAKYRLDIAFAMVSKINYLKVV